MTQPNEPQPQTSMSQKVAHGISWSFAEKLLTEVVSFVVTIVLARLLLPEAYGVVGILQIFVTILQVFVNYGLGTALVQKKDPDKQDYSTVFIANFLIGIILYAGLFLAAPLIARFCEVPLLTPMMRVLALKLPIAGIYNIQVSYVQKNLQFKKMFFSSLAGTLLSGGIGVWMAYHGWGAWALVAHILLDQFIDSVVLFLTTRWFPTLRFSKEKFLSLNRFAWKVTFSELISKLYEQIRLFVIGKVYTTSDLAYNSKAQSFPQQIVETINTTIVRVMFPTFSHYQNDINKLRSVAQLSVKITAFCLCPLMIGLVAVANQLIPWMLTDAWNLCIPYLQLYSFTYLFQPLQSVNIKMVQAIGRSDITLKSEIIKKTSGLAALVLAIVIFNTPFAVAASFSVMSLLALFINAWPCRKLLGYGLGRQLLDILPSLLLSGAMGGIVMLIPLCGWPYFPTLMAQVAVGAVVYVGGAWLLKFEQFLYIINFIKRKRSA